MQIGQKDEKRKALQKTIVCCNTSGDHCTDKLEFV